MRQFFKFVTASCLGTILAFFAFFGILILVASIAGASKSKSTGTNTYITLDLNRAIPEKSDNVVQSAELTFDPQPAIGLQDIRRILQKAAKDKSVDGIVIKSSMGGEIGNAKTSTLMKYLKEFKNTGKKIYAYGDLVGQSEYLLMSVADSIFINPQGGVDFRGFSRVIPFYKNMLDKIGVEMNVFYAGDFKSATEPYLRTSMSENSKTQSRAFLSDLEDIYFDSLLVNRTLDLATLKSAQAEYSIRYAQDAIDFGLVDKLAYWEEFENFLMENSNLTKKSELNLTSIDDYNTANGKALKQRGKNKIAVVYAEGVIEYGKEGPGNICEIDYHKVFDQIDEKDNIKAVVLRVNSPGGNAYSSEQIWHRVQALKDRGIPVIASYGNYAASGGYYISCNADTIVAQPNTITGSIGVFGMFPDASRLLNDKLGINFDTVKTSPYAVAITPFYDLRPDEEQIMKSSIDRLYDLFLKRVSDGRNMTKEAIHEVAQGRVWSGVDALEVGLVDVIGDLDDAIAIAAETADIQDDYGIQEYPYIEANMFQKVLAEIGKETRLAKVIAPRTQLEKQVVEQYSMMRQLLQCQEPQMLLPFAY